MWVDCVGFGYVGLLDRDAVVQRDGLAPVCRQSIPAAQGVGSCRDRFRPPARREYSGPFNMRIDRRVHRALAIEAAQAGVSLNALGQARLAGHARL
ncbi:MAG: toxin-antitoxin system HicB family antitoxin [Janthinobacterium lividum]